MGFITNALSFITGVFFNELKDLIKNNHNRLLIIGGVILLIAFVLAYFERGFLKEFTLDKRKGKNRLLRVLENIYFENILDDKDK
jgi:hypothetical protein